MFEHIHHRLTLLLLSGLGLTACAHLQNDAYFAGFHASDPSRSTTPSIIDRGLLITAPLPSEGAQVDVEPENLAEPYRDWRRGRYRDDAFAQYNLMAYLYGPYYDRDYRSRLWLEHQRRWNRIPWYAYDPLFDDFWMVDPYWRSRYWGGSGWYDPWYAGYYDPWYWWDPYYGGGYGLGYSGFGGYYDYWPYGYTRRSTVTTVADVTANKQRRPRSRRDLPTTMIGGNTRAAGSSSTQTRSGRTAAPSTHRRSVSVSGQSRASSAPSKARSGGSRQARTRQRKD